MFSAPIQDLYDDHAKTFGIRGDLSDGLFSVYAATVEEQPALES